MTDVAAGGCYGTPLWAADGSLVVTYEDHVTPPELRRLRDGGARAPRRLRAGLGRQRPRTSCRRRSRSRPPTGWRSARSSTGRARATVLRRPSSIRTAGRRSSRATSGTASPSTSSTRATPGCRSTTAARPVAARRSSISTTWTGAAATCVTASPRPTTCARSTGSTASRLAIFGASYGSYMALCAAVEDAGERFRCAVCKYGDCDLVTTWAQGDWDGIRYCGENMLGHPGVNRDVYLRGSPFHRLERVAVPLLVAAGELDVRVSASQSAQLVAELRRLGKTYEYVTYPTEAPRLPARGAVPRLPPPARAVPRLVPALTRPEQPRAASRVRLDALTRRSGQVNDPRSPGT